MNLTIEKINKDGDFITVTRDMLVDFLFTQLEQFSDPKEHINKCLDYALSNDSSRGGFALIAYVDNKIVGAVIMNNTGMSHYIPEWILVYIAVDSLYRGNEIGKQIIEEVYKNCDGNIKLHVEYDNPAKRLYERMGFVNKYADMRYTAKR